MIRRFIFGYPGYGEDGEQDLTGLGLDEDRELPEEPG